MSDEVPRWTTGVLWGILAVLLVLGTVGAGTVVYGFLGLVGHAPNAFDAIALAVGAIVAVLAFLFMAGILYRVDRYRGVPHREVKLFE